MAKLIYAAITSLDGFVADADGNFGWAAPDEEVHAFVNDLERPIGTYLYGRKMYEVMQYWATVPIDEDQPVEADYIRIWQGSDKVVYSTTLEAVSTPRTRLARSFGPDAVRDLKARADSDISIGGPTIAAGALRAGLVDEVLLFLNPIVIGSGNPALPDDVRIELNLLDEHRFPNGVVYLRYQTRS